MSFYLLRFLFMLENSMQVVEVNPKPSTMARLGAQCVATLAYKILAFVSIM